MKKIFLLLGVFMGFTWSVQAQRNKDIDPPQEKRRAVEFETFLSPGGGYSMFIPQDQNNLGIFHGPVIEFVFYSDADERYRGPSHYRLYTRMNLLQSTQDTVRGMFLYGFGGNFSFESAVYRNFGVPYFGLELGGMHQPNVGNTFQLSPLIGIHLISTENISLNLFGAYTIATQYYDRLSGYNVGASLNVSFW